jgi:hypothetical protein
LGDKIGIGYLHSMVISALREENSKKLFKDILTPEKLISRFGTDNIDEAIDILEKEGEFLKMFKLAE